MSSPRQTFAPPMVKIIMMNMTTVTMLTISSSAGLESEGRLRLCVCACAGGCARDYPLCVSLSLHDVCAWVGVRGQTTVVNPIEKHVFTIGGKT